MTDELITVSQGVALLDAQTAVRIAEFERKRSKRRRTPLKLQSLKRWRIKALSPLKRMT